MLKSNNHETDIIKSGVTDSIILLRLIFLLVGGMSQQYTIPRREIKVWQCVYFIYTLLIYKGVGIVESTSKVVV